MSLPQEKHYTEDDYCNIPEDVRAELIDGTIYYQAAPSRTHQRILVKLCSVIDRYISEKGSSCEVYPAPFAIKLDGEKNNIVEPDISVICDTDKLSEKGCTGAPDWIIEIVSPNNSSHDYVRKLDLYNSSGVREYWIVNPKEQNIMVYHLEEFNFKLTPYTFNDSIPVGIYDGFSITLANLI